MKAQNKTIETIRQIQVKNNDKFEDLNQGAFSKAVDEWDVKHPVTTILDDLENQGIWDFGKCYWELQENGHGKIDFFTITGLPPVQETELSEQEFKKVKDALYNLVSIWTEKLQEKVEAEIHE